MTTYVLKLHQIPFEKIANGQKIIESRLFDEKRSIINIGDEIIFSQNENPSNTVKTKVIALYRYPSFERLFSDFPSSYFGGDSKEFLLDEISKFYSEEDQNKYGVIGIKFGIVSNIK